MKNQRKHYTPEEKVTILRRYLLEQVPISARQREIHAERIGSWRLRQTASVRRQQAE